MSVQLFYNKASIFKILLSCLNCVFQQINMIQDQHLLSYGQDFFCNPESLQQLRDSLTTLFYHQQNSFSSVIDSLHKISVPFQQQNLSQIPLKKLNQCTQELQEQFRQKSSNLSVLINMSTKMIDFIVDEQYKTRGMIQGYQCQIEQLRSNIDYLTNTKNVIQNDVDLFREQLQAARSQLEDIIDEKQEINQDQPIQFNFVQYQIRRQMQKDRKIQMLEEELENIKEELKSYKFNSFSRQSLNKLKQGNKLLRYKSQTTIISTLKYRITSKINQQGEYKNDQTNKWQDYQEQQQQHEQTLVQQQKTRDQYKFKINQDIIQLENTLNYLPIIYENHQSGHQTPSLSQNQQTTCKISAEVSGSFIFNQQSANPQRQQQLMCNLFSTKTNQLPQIQHLQQIQTKQTVDINLINQQTTSWLLRNTSLTLINRPSQKLSQKSDQEKEDICPIQIEQEEKPKLTSNDSYKGLQAYHYLSSEWSAKSFEDNICNPIDLLQSNKAIYLTEQDSLSESSIKASIGISLNKNTQQTKYTQSSMKGFSTQEYLSTIKMKAQKQANQKQSQQKELQQRKHKKINSQKNAKKKPKQEVQAAQKSQPSFLDTVFEFVVGNRVRRYRKK